MSKHTQKYIVTSQQARLTSMVFLTWQHIPRFNCKVLFLFELVALNLLAGIYCHKCASNIIRLQICFKGDIFHNLLFTQYHLISSIGVKPKIDVFPNHVMSKPAQKVHHKQ